MLSYTIYPLGLTSRHAQKHLIYKERIFWTLRLRGKCDELLYKLITLHCRVGLCVAVMLYFYNRNVVLLSSSWRRSVA
jgi:hypothetical protein